MRQTQETALGRPTALSLALVAAGQLDSFSDAEGRFVAEKKSVERQLDAEAPAFTNQDLKRVVEPGAFDVMLGTSEPLKTPMLEVRREPQP